MPRTTIDLAACVNLTGSLLSLTQSYSSLSNFVALSSFLLFLCSSFIFSGLLAVSLLSQPFHALFLYSLFLFSHSPAELFRGAGPV